MMTARITTRPPAEDRLRSAAERLDSLREAFMQGKLKENEFLSELRALAAQMRY